MKYGREFLQSAWVSVPTPNKPIDRVCLIPRVSGVGGMVTFRDKLSKGLAERGFEMSYDLSDTPYRAILVIGGTRDLAGIWRAKRQGVRVVQRLDGMNWIHHRKNTGWRHFIRAEYGNFILSIIRSHLADRIIYQSKFSHQWWERLYGRTRIPWQVVYNGVDLNLYSPVGSSELPVDHFRILLVEGNIGSGYEMGLQAALQLAERINSIAKLNVEVMVVGRVSASLKQEVLSNSKQVVTFLGEVPAENIASIDRSAHVLYAADLNPACPNSVIEALACGLPVAGFDTGALPEIVTGDSGVIVPYGGDPWKLDPPDIDGLAHGIRQILDSQPAYRTAARLRAEQAFGLEAMVDGYLQSMEA
jgi:glycosyltransferase involved in cell wall biosynthesis